MAEFLDDLELLLGPAPVDPRAVYDRVADRYERFRALWIGLAGDAVEQALLAELRAILKPGHRVLDAGCGTGALARRIVALQPAVALTMLDLAPAMLAHAADIPGQRLEGSVLALPFPAGSFDIVVSGWVIETVPAPRIAVAEYLRVIKEDGYVLYTFCSLPEGWVSRAGTALLRAAVEHRFAGHFLAPEETAWHDCDRSRRVRSRNGLTTFIELRKCCAIAAGILPAAHQDAPLFGTPPPAVRR